MAYYLVTVLLRYFCLYFLALGLLLLLLFPQGIGYIGPCQQAVYGVGDAVFFCLRICLSVGLLFICCAVVLEQEGLVVGVHGDRVAPPGLPQGEE